MTVNIPLLRLQDAWRECERHVHHLFHAMSAIRPLYPLTAGTYAALSDDQVQHVDQFVFRFIKLQDAIGARFFPAVLRYLEEPFEDSPMLDKLHRLEKLGYIHSVENWQRLREIRNKFSHEYPDDMEKNAARLNQACEAAVSLYEVLATAATRLTTEHSELMLGRPLPENARDWING